MTISVTDPIGRAFNRAKLITFQPFNIGKWFTLGFCSFLASLAEGGGGSFNVPSGGGGGPSGGTGNSGPSGIDDTVKEFTAWFNAHFLEIILIASAIVVFLVLLSLLILWISSRGQFMFLDGIAKNTAEVIAPWKRYRHLGNSYCLFRISMSLTSFGVMIIILAAALLIAWQDIRAQTFGAGAIIAIIAGSLCLIVSTLVVALIDWCGREFVTTIMYARNITVLPAWREFREKIVKGHVGSLVLFLLMSWLVSLGAAMVMLMLGCMTLCLGFLPYLHNVVTLPVSIFLRSYSVYYLQQFGPEYTIMIEPPPPLPSAFPVIFPPSPPAV